MRGGTPTFTKKRVIAVLAIAATVLVTWGTAVAHSADSWS